MEEYAFGHSGFRVVDHRENGREVGYNESITVRSSAVGTANIRWPVRGWAVSATTAACQIGDYEFKQTKVRAKHMRDYDPTKNTSPWSWSTAGMLGLLRLRRSFRPAMG